MIRLLKKESRRFVIGQKTIDYNEKDPIFSLKGPIQETNYTSRGNCNSCETAFKNYKVIKYWYNTYANHTIHYS